ncbi:MAG: zinc metallopeptidase [Christensenellaceae bacterium]|jgi:Zn-dependent membrane protease YugP|nr:zinc metallopeptidase [Christensenellaceae bacterium]
MNWEIIYIISSVLILPVMIWAIVVSIQVEVVFNKYKKVDMGAGITARELVNKIAKENGLNITVTTASGFLGDHYDPKHKVVALSRDNIDSGSIAALAVAAHECGHAMQDKEQYFPLKTRNFVISLSNFASRLLLPLVIIGLVLSVLFYLDPSFVGIIMIALCAVYGMSALVGLITLPTEFDASRRAKKMLDEMFITDDITEKRGVRRVLSAAAQTYVASFAVSLLYFLRLLSYLYLVLGRRD